MCVHERERERERERVRERERERENQHTEVRSTEQAYRESWGCRSVGHTQQELHSMLLMNELCYILERTCRDSRVAYYVHDIHTCTCRFT